MFGNSPSGMQNVFASLGSKASTIANNSQKQEVFRSFIGPENMGAAKRIRQIGKLVSELTGLPDQVVAYANSRGMSAEQAQEFYNACVTDIAGVETSSLADAISPFAYSEGGFKTRRDAKYETAKYISQNIGNPTPEFAQEMAMAATMPIAKQMIPNTVFLKAFITDSCEGELTKPYYTKKRVTAYQQGLNADVSQLKPSEIMTYNPILVTPEAWERNITVDHKYIETMNFDVAQDMLTDGGRELQVLIDQIAFKALDAAVPNAGSAPAAGSTVNGFNLDATGTVMTLESGLNPQVEHLNFANQILRNRGYRPDLIITSPYELATLMSQQAILMAYAYGTREVQETGMVGSLLGNAVAWTPNLYQNGAASSYVIWVCDSDELARVVLGHPITVYPDFQFRSLAFKLYTRLAIFFRNTQSCVKIVCSNSESGIT